MSEGNSSQKMLLKLPEKDKRTKKKFYLTEKSANLSLRELFALIFENISSRPPPMLC